MFVTFEVYQRAPPIGPSTVKAAVILTLVLGAFAAGVILTIDRGFGHGVEAFAGVLMVLLALTTLAGLGETTFSIGGQGEFVVGSLPGGSAQAWALRLMPVAMGVSAGVIGGAMFVHALDAVGSAQLARVGALASVPVCLAMAFVRWTMRAEIAAAGAAEPERGLNLEVPKPSEKLQEALGAALARHPVPHTILILGFAAFCVLVAVSPPLAKTVGEIADFPWQLLDDVFASLFGWLPGI